MSAQYLCRHAIMPLTREMVRAVLPHRQITYLICPQCHKQRYTLYYVPVLRHQVLCAACAGITKALGRRSASSSAPPTSQSPTPALQALLAYHREHVPPPPSPEAPGEEWHVDVSLPSKKPRLKPSRRTRTRAQDPPR